MIRSRSLTAVALGPALLLWACATVPASEDPSATPEVEEPTAPTVDSQAPPPPAAAAPSRSTLDGVYTSQQASRGRVVATDQCSICHSPQSDWPLTLESWSGRPLLELFEYVRATMPQTNPGSLTNAQYAEIFAYMLELGGLPPGATELPSGDAGLQDIQLVTLAR